MSPLGSRPNAAATTQLRAAGPSLERARAACISVSFASHVIEKSMCCSFWANHKYNYF